MAEEHLILVGNVGAGWFPPIKMGEIDPNSWGNRKLAAIKARRAETGEDYKTALKWVEDNFPEFKRG